MSQPKYTPGGWTVEVEPAKVPNPTRYTIRSGDDVIAFIYSKPKEGDAYLIAAAPDLLEACKRLLSADDQLANEGDAEPMHSAIKAACAAIAKAEGHKS